MFPLKLGATQNVVMFASDANGDSVTGIADGSWTKRISKAGGTFAGMTVVVSELEAGFYAVPLSAAHTDTLGVLTLRFSAAGAKQVNLQYRVDARVPDDHAFPAVTGRSLDVDASGRVSVFGFAADAITASAIATDALGSLELAAGAVTEIAGAVWEELRSAHTTANTFGQGVASVQGNVTGSVATLTGHTPQTGDTFARLGAPVGASISVDVAGVQSDTNDIQTRLPAALVTGRMDSSVGAMATDTLTAAALAASAVTEIQAGLSTAASLATVQADTDDIQARLPAALVAGRIDSSVGAMAANSLTATAINADAFTAAKFAADVTTEFQAGLATAAALATVQADTDDIQTRLPAVLVSGRIDASVGAMAADTITAAAVATDALGSLELAAGAVAEIADAVWDELRSGHVGAGSFGEGTLVESLNAAARAQVNVEVLDVWTVDSFGEPGAVPAASSSLKDKIAWMFTLSRNRLTQSPTLTVVRDSGDTTDLATAVTSDSGSLAVRSEWT